MSNCTIAAGLRPSCGEENDRSRDSWSGSKFFVLFIIFFISCTQPIKNQPNDWFELHESKISAEIDRRIVQRLKDDKNDIDWRAKSFVVTQYDSTILGEFAKEIYYANPNYEILYTVRKNYPLIKITIIKTDSMLVTTNEKFLIKPRLNNNFEITYDTFKIFN